MHSTSIPTAYVEDGRVRATVTGGNVNAKIFVGKLRKALPDNYDIEVNGAIVYVTPGDDTDPNELASTVSSLLLRVVPPRETISARNHGKPRRGRGRGRGSRR